MYALGHMYFMKSKNVGVGFAAVLLGRGVVKRTKRFRSCGSRFASRFIRLTGEFHDIRSFLPYGWRGGFL